MKDLYKELLDLKTPEAERFLSKFQQVSHPSGFQLCKEGEPQKEAFVIKSGKIRRMKLNKSSNSQVEIDSMGEGDTIGFLHLFNADNCFATLECVGDCQLLKLTQDELKSFLNENPAFAMVLLAVLSRKLRTSEKLLTAIHRISAETDSKIRVAVFDSSKYVVIRTRFPH
jgi:CRP-like cAMP-binding protein